jgi:ketosteroid isomerase-like protein
MRLLTIIAISILAVASAPGVSRAQDVPPAPMPTVTLPPEMDRVLRDYERLWAAGDEAGLAGLFTEDGFILQNGRPPVRGREGIQRAYADFSGPLRLRAIGFGAGDTVGYIIGMYTYGDGAEMGKFVLALRREPGGAWMIASDMDNMNQMPRRGPAPPPQP